MPTLTPNKQGNITKTVIEALPAPDPSGKLTLYSHPILKGFGVLVNGSRDVKTYVVQKDLRKKTIRRAIGSTSIFTLEQAEERAIGMLQMIKNGIDPREAKQEAEENRQRGIDEADAKERNAITLREGMEKALDLKKHSLQASTLDYYRRSIENHLSDWLDEPMKDIDKDRVLERYGAVIEKIVKAARQKNVHGKTAAKAVMISLGAVWNTLLDVDYDLPPCPVRVVSKIHKGYSISNARKNRLNNDQFQPFYEAVMKDENTVMRDAILLMLFTGFRRNEVTRLSWPEVDFDNDMIRLPGSRTKSKQSLSFPMSDYIRGLLAARRGVHKKWVFPASRGDGALIDAKYALQRIETATGIKVGNHDLRRTWTSVAANIIPFPAIEKLTDHKSKTVTTTHYIVYCDDELAAHSQSVTDALKRLCSIGKDEGKVVTLKRK